MQSLTNTQVLSFVVVSLIEFFPFQLHLETGVMWGFVFVLIYLGLHSRLLSMASRPDAPDSACDGLTSTRRCRWETSGNKLGIELVDRAELAISDGSSILGLQQISCDMLHPGAKGITFLTLQSAKRHLKLSTSNPCVGIVKGFQKQALVQAGIDEKRLQQIVATLRDTTTLVVEPRAVTLINFAEDSELYIFMDDNICEMTLPEQPMVNIIFEMRQKSTSPEFWRAFSDLTSFTKYTSQVVEREDDAKESVFYPTMCKADYIFRRAVIPLSIRNQVYAQSGFKGITVKAIRQSEHHIEEGLELLRLQGMEGKTLHEIWADGHERSGWLGAFHTAQATYVRISDDYIGEARRQWAPNDPRWTKSNQSIKLSLFYKIQGFVAGINIPEATKILEEVGWIVVVLRIFQTAELTTLIVGTNKEPPQTRFSSNFGTVLISSLEAKTRSTIAKKSFRSEASTDKMTKPKRNEEKSAPNAPSSSSSAPSDPWASAANARTSNRVDALERKVTALSEQIDKVEKAHDSTRDQLSSIKESQDRGFQQLLAAIAELKGGQSQASTPVRSPAQKISKLS